MGSRCNLGSWTLGPPCRTYDERGWLIEGLWPNYMHRFNWLWIPCGCLSKGYHWFIACGHGGVQTPEGTKIIPTLRKLRECSSNRLQIRMKKCFYMYIRKHCICNHLGHVYRHFMIVYNFDTNNNAVCGGYMPVGVGVCVCGVLWVLGWVCANIFNV